MTVEFSSKLYSGTSSPLWFRLKGTTNVWTDWFSKSNLTDEGTVYNWYQEFLDVGDIVQVIVLNRANDGVFIRTIGVDDESYTFTSSSNGIWLKYSNGGPQFDGCAVVHVNFSDSTDDYDFYAGEDLGGVTCPYLIEYSFPTLEPTLSPTVPTEAPIPSPTVNPTSVPTVAPSVHQRFVELLVYHITNMFFLCECFYFIQIVLFCFVSFWVVCVAKHHPMSQH